MSERNRKHFVQIGDRWVIDFNEVVGINLKLFEKPPYGVEVYLNNGTRFLFSENNKDSFNIQWEQYRRNL